MLYRKYRPQKFNEVIGSPHIATAISNALFKNESAHAFFLYGSRGVGKTTTARLLAKSLNCENPIISEKSAIPFEPCGECASCKAVETGRHLDLIEIDAASNRGIDSIRELIDKVKLSPAMGKRKVYIIDEVHMLTNEASNALLKTLEEPPEHAYFILCTTNPEKVLDTIKSRCQQFIFKRPSLTEIQEKISYILKKEGKEVPSEIIPKIASGAKGAFRDAETLLEQILNKGEGNFSFGSDYDDYVNLMKLLAQKDTAGSLTLANKVLNNESSVEVWTENFIEFLHSVILYKLGVKESLGIYESAYKSEEKNLASINIEFLKTSIYAFSKAMEDFRYVALPSLPIEMAIINICNNSNDNSKINETKIQPAPVASKPKPAETPNVVKSVPLSIPVLKPEQAPSVSVIEEDLVAAIESDNSPQPEVNETEVESKIKYPREFPFKKMVIQLKETNHSIYLLLGTATVEYFAEGALKLRVPYSFHKERLLSTKIRTTIEKAATDLIGAKVLLECDLISAEGDGADLTDKNIKIPKKEVPLEKVFEDVFGDDIVN
jgi:DNA polymerase III subunit gamma/tau